MTCDNINLPLNNKYRNGGVMNQSQGKDKGSPDLEILKGLAEYRGNISGKLYVKVIMPDTGKVFEYISDEYVLPIPQEILSELLQKEVSKDLRKKIKLIIDTMQPSDI